MANSKEAGTLTVVTCLLKPNTKPAGLEHLINLSRDGGEVYIVDLFPEGEKPSWLVETITYYPQPKQGPLTYHMGIVYNKVIEKAHGEVMIFLGDDVICGQDLFQRHLDVYTKAGPVLTITPVSPADPGSRWVTAENRIIPHLWLIDNAPWTLIGDFWSAPVSALRNVKGWNPAACIAARGDEDLAWRLWQSGLPIIIDQAVCATRLDLPGYPSSRWRGSPVSLLPLQYKNNYTQTFSHIMKTATAVLDHNRYHSRRAILSRQSLNRWQQQLNSGQLTEADVITAIPVYSLVDVKKAAALMPEDRRKLLLLDRSPDTESCLVAAVAALEKIRCIRDQLYIRSSRLAVTHLRCKHKLTKAGKNGIKRKLLKSLCEEIQKTRQKLLEEWPGWLSDNARGDKVVVLTLLDNEKKTSGTQQAKLSFSEPLFITSSNNGWSRGPVHEGYANPPRSIAVRVTNRCNMRCKMCGQHGPAGNSLKNQDNELPMDYFYNLIEEAVSAQVGMFYIWGGEPLLRKQTQDLIKRAKQAGLFTVLTTNGYFLADMAKALVDYGLDILRLSIDGPPAIHDQIRGLPGLFNRIMSGIKVFNNSKRSISRDLPALEIETTISPYNYTHLKEMVPIAQGAEAYALNYSHMVYAIPDEGKKRNDFFCHLFGKPAWTWKGFCLDTTMDYDVLARTVRQLQLEKQPLPVRFTPPLLDENSIKAHYQNPYEVYGRKACCTPWIWVEVHPDGGVYFCDDFHDIAVGNIVDQRLSDIWNDEKARTYRLNLLKQGRFPGCITCGLLNMDGVY